MKLSALEHLSMKSTNMGDRHHKRVVIQNGGHLKLWLSPILNVTGFRWFFFFNESLFLCLQFLLRAIFS